MGDIKWLQKWQHQNVIYSFLKFIYSEKATKMWRNLQTFFDITLLKPRPSQVFQLSRFLLFPTNQNAQLGSSEFWLVELTKSAISRSVAHRGWHCSSDAHFVSFLFNYYFKSSLFKSLIEMKIFTDFFCLSDCHWRSSNWDFSWNFSAHGQVDPNLHEWRPWKKTLFWSSHYCFGKNEENC